MFAAVDPFGVLALAAVGVLLLAALGTGVALLLGLFGARSLVRREIAAYFLSPVAYVVLVVFLAVTGYFFFLTLRQLTEHGPYGAEFPMQYMLGTAPDNWVFWLLFLLIPPLLTMRLFAEERNSGTLEMLMTAPVRDWQVVLAKFVACFAFYLLLWVPTLVYMPVLLDLHRPIVHAAWTPWSIALVAGLGLVAVALFLALLRLGTAGRVVNLALLLAGIAAAAVGAWGHYGHDAQHLIEIPAGIDPMPVVSSYVGLGLAGAMYLALGMFVSSLVRSPLVAVIVSWAVGMGFSIPGFWWPQSEVVKFFSVPEHFKDDFSRGLLDSRHLVLYASVAVFSLFLTVRSLEGRRWR